VELDGARKEVALAARAKTGPGKPRATRAASEAGLMGGVEGPLVADTGPLGADRGPLRAGVGNALAREWAMCGAPTIGK
jgi:hypothetical protein